MREALQKYQVDTPPLWEGLPILGLDGYSVMDFVRRSHWEAIPDWGQPGYNLGTWPLVIVFWREHNGTFEVIEYFEGDTTLYVCPTNLIRCQITDEIAYFHWRFTDMEWTQPYPDSEDVPLELKGPYDAKERAHWLADLEAERMKEPPE